MGGDFPALPAPATQGVTVLPVEAFLEALHGPGHGGVEAGGDPAAFPPPKLLGVDVRSPSEFATGHIPGAVNIPLFDDDARHVVGTAFAQKGRLVAIRTGLVHVGPRFCALVDALSDHGAKPGDRVLLYCWRGGMRSGSVAWLFSLCGFSVSTLEGGYRSYRRWCKTIVGAAHVLPPAPVFVLGGCTGVGKTAILLELRRRGEQVLDLEGLANHRGSAFGSMGQAPQPTNEAYENVLALAVRRLERGRRLWLEHEGDHVGKVLVPFGVNAWVRQAPGGGMVTVVMEQRLRVQRLVADYCSEENLRNAGWVDDLKTCISTGLAKKLGGQRVKDALRLLDEGRWDSVAEMMLEYYDKLYTRWADQSQSGEVLRVECPTLDEGENAALVLRAAEGLGAARGGEEPAGGGGDCAPGASAAASSKPPPDSQEAAPGDTVVGTCFCGEITVRCSGEPRSVSYCHCSICRRLSGAPFSCQALFEASQVELVIEPGAGLSSLKTSKGVERSRCSSCLSPVHASLFGNKISVVPLGLLAQWREGGGGAYRPRHHLYYGNRVMDVRDGLPKYAGAAARPGRADGTREGLLPEAEW